MFLRKRECNEWIISEANIVMGQEAVITTLDRLFIKDKKPNSAQSTLINQILDRRKKYRRRRNFICFVQLYIFSTSFRSFNFMSFNTCISIQYLFFHSSLSLSVILFQLSVLFPFHYVFSVLLFHRSESIY